MATELARTSPAWMRSKPHHDRPGAFPEARVAMACGRKVAAAALMIAGLQIVVCPAGAQTTCCLTGSCLQRPRPGLAA